MSTCSCNWIEGNSLALPKILQLPSHKPTLTFQNNYGILLGVAIPERHKEDGLVTITKTTGGEEFNWDKTPDGTMLKVRSKKWGKPDNAFVSVPYRGAWFFIADNDLNSKSTFTLLKQLFSLQAGHIRDAGPTLTLLVGGG